MVGGHEHAAAADAERRALVHGDHAARHAAPSRPTPNHVLPAWQTLTAAPSLAGKSGRGTYTTTVDLPAGWTGGHGAYLDLGTAIDTATVTVNGHDAGPIDQVDGGRRVDVGPLPRRRAEHDRRPRLEPAQRHRRRRTAATG